MSEDKIALILDELSGKVLGYKETGIGDYDVLMDKCASAIIQQACYSGKDVYYIDGELRVRDKDSEDYGNKIDALNIALSCVQADLKKQVVEINDRTPAFDALVERERELKHDIKELEAIRLDEQKNYRLSKLASTAFKYYCSICLIIRDENEYLKEWLEWHIGQGIEHFYIYDHGSKQPVSEFVDALDESIKNRVTVHYFGGQHLYAQHEAYNDCLKRYSAESRWIGFIDADEMVRVKCGKTVPELLRYYEEFAGLFMRWVVYDANGQVKKSDKPMRERFTHVTLTNADDGIGKTFLQPFLIQYVQTHSGFAYPKFEIVDENRHVVTDATVRKRDCTADLVCVDHYYTKSYEEWLEKMKRGTCDPLFNRKYGDFFMYNPDMEYCRENIYLEQKYEVSDKK